VLHIVNKSPFERNALESCLRLAADGSAVLLIEDGVVAAASNTRFGGMLADGMKRDLKFFVLSHDAAARGLAPERLAPGVETVDYGGFVDLVTSHDTVQSWL